MPIEAPKKLGWLQKRRGPVVLVIMDGVGYGKFAEGDAVQASNKPALDWLHANCPHTKMKAHGMAVGLPSDEDMGNSEVGHNAIGCGRVFAQGAKLVSASIDTGAMFAGKTWNDLTGNVLAKGSTLHFLGLFSDGNVHSHINHLKAMIVQAQKQGVKKVRVHILLDGRDVGETSGMDYIVPFEAFLKELNAKGVDYRIASGGGRMNITMDRYNANWDMVRRGWATHVHGEGTQFPDAATAYTTLRQESKAIDQDLPAFVIAENGKPVGAMQDDDSVIFFNFRGDRALEITAAFEQDELKQFDRGRRPKVMYAGMMEYDGDLHVPKRYLVTPPSIDRVMGEFVCAAGQRSLAISETQKYGHVTYFFNGNRSGKIDDKLEDYVEVLSDVVPFEQRPWMKSAEITDKVLDAIKAGKYDFIRMNYPNGDMVGHTGVFQSVQVAVEAVDIALSRIMKEVEKAGGVMIVSADHGNADDMFEIDKKSGHAKVENGIKKVKTAHSLNPVPCIIYDPLYKGEYKKELKTGLGISSLAATCLNFLGYEAPADYDASVIEKA
jgi:2,3-bisphosphoglycerate-independent phosphoglycerate mutase